MTCCNVTDSLLLKCTLCWIVRCAVKSILGNSCFDFTNQFDTPINVDFCEVGLAEFFYFYDQTPTITSNTVIRVLCDLVQPSAVGNSIKAAITLIKEFG